MDFPLISLNDFQLFLLSLLRVGSLIAAMPVLGGAQTAQRFKVGLTFVLGLLLFPLSKKYFLPIPFVPVVLLVVVIQEVLLGVLIGLIARLIFSAVEFGGTVIGYQMGFAAANVFDPQNQRQISLMSQFQNVFAILIFLSMDGHMILIRAIVSSFEVLPPGQIDFSKGAIPFLIDATTQMFILGVKFSAPILAVLLLSSLVLGIMARVFPQLNVFLLSFPLNIGLSFLVIGLTLPLIVGLLAREFHQMELNIFQLLKLL